ncbi:type II toxin-antitoxin system prevent-host-death family antitoxin [bacterium]|nr:type II toxin-antitoxin system prevent-host-death family antitoxin [bacterium]
MAARVGAYEAKTNLSKLLDRVERGESIVITRHGVPVARLVRVESNSERPVSEIIAEMRRISDNLTLGGLSIRELIEEGRRY